MNTVHAKEEQGMHHWHEQALIKSNANSEHMSQARYRDLHDNLWTGRVN